MTGADKPPSPADTMRVQLAKAHLQEVRGLDLAATPAATVLSAFERMRHELEDVIEILEKCWSEQE